MTTEASSHQHKKNGHDYHLVDPSPWPICTAFSSLALFSGAVMAMHKYAHGEVIFGAGLLMVIYCVYNWWKDVIKEGIVDKAHTNIVRKGLRIGMALFILSEVMFFFAFFWSFFKASLDPVHIIENFWPIKDGIWPPAGISPFDPWELPFINTLILLLSGTTVTWAHYELMHGNNKQVVKALALTVILGVSFTLLQAFEYIHAAFNFKDGIYPSNFFLATGFHGAHVIIGTIFLTVCLFRAMKGNLTKEGHLGFEFAAWYWHFVDVVWLFLFLFVYVWGR